MSPQSTDSWSHLTATSNFNSQTSSNTALVAINWMTPITARFKHYSYEYRADAIRDSKTLGSVTTKFAYDGQMPIESYDGTTSTRNILGARGMDATITGSGLSYPIYDAHGNNMGTLAKNGSGYTVANRLSDDAWGAVCSGTPAGTGCYCATLGHPQDDESGFVYMRARYYDATSGRFLSEDSSKDGCNWIAYAYNNPITNSDKSGHDVIGDTIIGLILGFLTPLLMYLINGEEYTRKGSVLGTIAGGLGGAGCAYLKEFINQLLKRQGMALARPGEVIVGAVGGVAGIAAALLGERAGECLFELFMMDFEEAYGFR